MDKNLSVAIVFGGIMVGSLIYGLLGGPPDEDDKKAEKHKKPKSEGIEGALKGGSSAASLGP